MLRRVKPDRGHPGVVRRISADGFTNPATGSTLRFGGGQLPSTERKAERVAVETGLHQEGRIEIRKGVAEGDEIVVAGTNKVFPGATLTTGPPATSGAREEPSSES